jgi:dihydroneopterin aldolase
MNQRRVFIRNWKIKVFTGIHAFEKGLKRELRINIEFFQDDAPANVIGDVINYSDHKKRMLEALGTTHHLLLENIADVLVNTAFADPKVRRVVIEIEKMKLYKDVESCGIAIDRTR